MTTAYSRDQRFVGSTNIGAYELAAFIGTLAWLTYCLLANGEIPRHADPLSSIPRTLDPLFTPCTIFAHRIIYHRRRAFQKPVGWVLAFMALGVGTGIIAGGLFGLLMTPISLVVWKSIRDAE